MMSGGAFVKFSVGTRGASSANIRYITREKAAEDRVWTQNMPEYASEGETRDEQIDNLKEYARQREEDELERPRTGGGETRTHYRAIYSFDRDVSDDQARQLVDEHMDENFSNARYVAAIHRDTDHNHVHVWIDARGTDDKKINLDRDQYRTLDNSWAETCSRGFDDREIYDQHISKKSETQDWKREAYDARQNGEEPPPKPARAADERDQVSEARTMEAHQYGGSYEESGAGGDQRPAVERESEVTAGEHAISSTEREIAELNRAIAETNRTIEQANKQTLERDRDDGLER